MGEKACHRSLHSKPIRIALYKPRLAALGNLVNICSCFCQIQLSVSIPGDSIPALYRLGHPNKADHGHGEVFPRRQLITARQINETTIDKVNLRTRILIKRYLHGQSGYKGCSGWLVAAFAEMQCHVSYCRQNHVSVHPYKVAFQQGRDRCWTPEIKSQSNSLPIDLTGEILNRYGSVGYLQLPYIFQTQVKASFQSPGVQGGIAPDQR